ncbi:hypothetical protein [Streptomyces uncialis]|uniref:hypothetical protein n=1 Tax=Streptomyces uncialis TaxID=1048205 RepID=UPI003869A2A9|nr:hypothetical protein OG268_19700 [Streptomyces uncialis]
MTAVFAEPPRHAPGFPPGCLDTGDVLARLAAAEYPAVTLVVVTSALRARVEGNGDHESALAEVRRDLATLGSFHGPSWNPSCYGKDLVLARPGSHEPPRSVLPSAGGPPEVRTHLGWAWDRVALDGDTVARREALLRACYPVSMAARLRRDHPHPDRHRAPAALAEVPGRLTVRGTASLLAGVLVRPYGGGDDGPGAGPGEDPRLPGVGSADSWTAWAGEPGPHPTGVGHALPPARSSVRAVPGDASESWYALTDVHDIEWGTPYPSPADGRLVGAAHGPLTGAEARLTNGNARDLLPLATEWHKAGRPDEGLLDRAYTSRLRRERLLALHLRTLGDAVAGRGRLYATLGDGLSGLVAGPDVLHAAVDRANAVTAGGMRSGAGAARLRRRDGGPEAALRQARAEASFALHVTKTLKGSGQPQDSTQSFGAPVRRAAADAALDFLVGLREAEPGTPGLHHLAHARRWYDWWLRHVPPSHADRFTALLKRPAPAAGARHG